MTVLFFHPKDGYFDSTQAPLRCSCREMTAGPCSVCAPRLADPAAPVTVSLTISGTDELLAKLRIELAQLVRRHAALEAGPVGTRLRQIADEFDANEGMGN